MRKLQTFLWALLILGLMVQIANAKPIDRKYLSNEIKATLKDTGLYSRDVHNLLMGTAATETDFGQCKTMNSGKDLGLLQIEISTHDDIWENWLPGNSKHMKLVRSVMWPVVPKKTQLKHNLKYQIMIAAIHYHRAHFQHKCLDRKKFSNDTEYIWWMAWVYKKFYNTVHGKGTTSRFFDKYHEYVYKKD